MLANSIAINGEGSVQGAGCYPLFMFLDKKSPTDGPD